MHNTSLKRIPKSIPSGLFACFMSILLLVQGHTASSTQFIDEHDGPQSSEGVTTQEVLNDENAKEVKIMISSYPSTTRNVIGWREYNDLIAPAITLHLGERMHLKIKTIYPSKPFYFDQKENDLSTLKTILSPNFEGWAHEPEDNTYYYGYTYNRPYYHYWIGKKTGKITLEFDGMIEDKNQSGYWPVSLKIPITVIEP